VKIYNQYSIKNHSSIQSEIYFFLLLVVYTALCLGLLVYSSILEEAFVPPSGIC
jgi:hypothetical protein